MFIIMLQEKNKMLKWAIFFVKYSKHVQLLYILFVFLFHKIKFVGVRKGDKGLTGGVSLEPFPWQGDFLLFVPIFKKGRFFFFPRTKSCESNSCCFLFSEQRPSTQWKLIRHSGAVVNWNGHREMSQFFSKPWYFVASDKDGSVWRGYETAPFFVSSVNRGGGQKKLRNLRAESDGMLNLFS